MLFVLLWSPGESDVLGWESRHIIFPQKLVAEMIMLPESGHLAFLRGHIHNN